jgi:hypothetical protein
MQLATVTALAALMAFPAFGQAYPDQNDLDIFAIEQVDENTAIVTYYNSASQSSAGHPPEMATDLVTVSIDLDVTSGPETIHVAPEDGWIAYPPQMSAEDGETVQIKVIRFLGF